MLKQTLDWINSQEVKEWRSGGYFYMSRNIMHDNEMAGRSVCLLRLMSSDDLRISGDLDDDDYLRQSTSGIVIQASDEPNHVEVDLENAERIFHLAEICRSKKREMIFDDLKGFQNSITQEGFQITLITSEGDLWVGCQTIPWIEVDRVADELGWKKPRTKYTMEISYAEGAKEPIEVYSRIGPVHAIAQVVKTLRDRKRKKGHLQSISISEEKPEETAKARAKRAK